MSESESQRDPYYRPRPRDEVADRWIESSDRPELRRVELAGWKDVYALATAFDRDTGLPIEEETLWHGDKGAYFDLWNASVRFAAHEHPALIDDIASRSEPSSRSNEGPGIGLDEFDRVLAFVQDLPVLVAAPLGFLGVVLIWQDIFRTLGIVLLVAGVVIYALYGEFPTDEDEDEDDDDSADDDS